MAGFFAGFNTRLAKTFSATPLLDEHAKVKYLDIIYGTQTGNAEGLAEAASTAAQSKGFTPRLAEMDEVEMDQLAKMQNLIVVVSTYGEGEMPNNAIQFWEALSASTAPRLESLNFGVLALGDTSYDEFCQAGKLVDTRLEQLGANRLGPRIDCDVDFEDLAEVWIESTIPDPETIVAIEPIIEASTKPKMGWGRKKPYISNMIYNSVISGPKSSKEIRHIAFDLGDSGMNYEAGDALGVIPVNAPDLVEAWLTRLGVNGDTDIGGEALGSLLRTDLEIVTPSRDLILGIAPFAKNDELNHLLATKDKEAMNAYLWGKDVLDLLNLNPNASLDAAEVVSWLRPLQHRAYSISSSPKAYDREVHLTVAAVRWMNENRPHKGVCSTFIADHLPVGAQAPIFISPNKSFRVPEDDEAPIIMVGPGTGIAPFRAFLEERRERGSSGSNWLFFGDRHRKSDFIYEDEITAFSRSGILTRLDLAFSRDQTEKFYVQHRLIENSKDLFAQLEEGGFFYVCGDASKMAKDVDLKLQKIIEEQLKCTSQESFEYIKKLKKEKRYLLDVY